MINLHRNELISVKMNVTECLNSDLKPFDQTTTVLDAQLLFDEYGFSHFPVIDDDVFLGMVSQDDVLFFDVNKKIGDFVYSFKGFFGRSNDEVITLLEIFAKNKTSILAVLGENQEYVGYYLIEDVVGLFSDYPFLNEYGSTLVIGKDIDNFSMSQVAQIVESNDLQSLGLLVTKMEEDRVEITVRLNHDVTDGLVQAFRRYGYEILNTIDEDSYLIKLKERSDYLSKYLDI